MGNHVHEYSPPNRLNCMQKTFQRLPLFLVLSALRVVRADLVHELSEEGAWGLAIFILRSSFGINNE